MEGGLLLSRGSTSPLLVDAACNGTARQCPNCKFWLVDLKGIRGNTPYKKQHLSWCAFPPLSPSPMAAVRVPGSTSSLLGPSLIPQFLFPPSPFAFLQPLIEVTASCLSRTMGP